MNVFGRRIDGPGGRRVAPRDPLLLPASITTLDSAYSVALLNISPTGAKIRCDQSLRLGQDVWVKAPPVNTLAEVMWCAEDQYGIHFDEPLSDAEYDHLRELGRWTLVTKLTPEEQQAAADWANGTAR